MGKILYLDGFDFIDPPDESVSDIYIGPPRTIIKERIFNIEILNIKNLNSHINTPWIELSRNSYMQDGKTIMIEKYVIKKSFLTFKEYESQLYSDFKLEFAKKFKKVFLVI